PGAEARRAAATRAPGGDLRRRHPARGPARDPPAVQPRPDQPRHAQRGRPPPPQALGRLPGQPRLGRGGRGPYLPRSLRLARGERAETAAPCRPALRRGAPLHPRVGPIANPGELAERLTGLPFELLDDDGAPRAGREIAIWNPPVIERRTMTRRSPVSEASDLLVELVSRGVRTICFMRSRRGIELINRFASIRLTEEGRGELADRIAPYRAGYTPQQRREIESQLASGELLAVAATDALELGIDVGELDAAICVNFPGTVASLRQMWGRAGRRRRGLAVYVAGEDALDQFFCRHP